MSDTKICTKCGRELPLGEFYRNKKNKDGLQSSCKCCHKSVSREWVLRNRDRVNDNARKFRDRRKERGVVYSAPIGVTTKVCNICGKELPLECFYNNKVGVYGKQGQCKDCQRLQHRSYIEENKDKKREYDKRYRESENGKKQRYKYNHREDVLVSNRLRNKRYRETSDKWAEGIKNSKRKKPEKYRELARKYSEKYRKELNDNYILQLLTSRGKAPRKCITKDLIELERAQVMIIREIKQKAEVENNINN